ncbi:acyl--CoA ligase [Dactylosporangium sp. NBC_01737]|uniref:class I adenylate-forming enzyme family protein n=1 Tax=Dactylosporangium sp. NBC_01737 TaxID=2975959 RepID=UPI002E0DB63C|nr:acyl--CoA ligase [Dactylosporangium sp. NBC_01737]
MGYVELTPHDLLKLGFDAPEVTDGAWHVDWAPVAGQEPQLPDVVDFHTSGSTGPRQTWRRTGEQLWTEAGILAGLFPQRPDAVVSFVPPVHVYGALATVLVPARLGVPCWYRKSFFGAMPATGGRRIVVAATPWIFTLLLQHLDWVRSHEQVTVLHSSAMLPATAGDLLAQAGNAGVVEILGSTEAGGIATRSWRGGDPPPWTLFPDVTWAARPGPDAGEVPLVVRSPRLAHRPGAARPEVWHTDDHVEPVDERTFRFAGRRNRLVKVNGRRINLDEVEQQLRPRLDTEDLAVVPVADPMIGEHLDLLLVLRPGTTLADLDLVAVNALIGVRPRKVRVLPRIARSETGKVSRIQADDTMQR